MAIDYSVLANPKPVNPAKALARQQAKADKAVYQHVSDRDGLHCRACGTYAGIDAHRHHLRGRKFTTPEDVCCVCDDCHDRMHVRVGGVTLKLSGNAEIRNRYGVPDGLTAQWRRRDSWQEVRGL